MKNIATPGEKVSKGIKSGSITFPNNKTENKNVYLFIHGYGTSPADIFPLAKIFIQKEYFTDFLCLKGHDDFTELANVTYSEWYEQLKKRYLIHKKANRKIILIGFSLGATLAFDFASKNDIDGIISISGFMGHRFSYLTNRILKVYQLLKIKNKKRHLQTTKKKTRKEIYASLYLPINTTQMIIREAHRVSQGNGCIDCPVLFFHSHNDRVASYKKIKEFISNSFFSNYRLIPFRGLNHHLQFDMSPEFMFETIIEYLQISPNTSERIDEAQSLELVYNQCREESRFWANIIFKIIVGFFSIFGALLYFSLETILKKMPEAPYFLISYSIVINTYILLLSLYFFYMNRVDVYIKYHLEPQMLGFPWISFRTMGCASGKESERITKHSSIFIGIIPILASISIIIYSLKAYSFRFFVYKNENVFIQIFMLTAIVLLIAALKSTINLRLYNIRELYRKIPFYKTTPVFENMLLKLYSTIKPGSVKQPVEFFKQKNNT